MARGFLRTVAALRALAVLPAYQQPMYKWAQQDRGKQGSRVDRQFEDGSRGHQDEGNNTEQCEQPVPAGVGTCWIRGNLALAISLHVIHSTTVLCGIVGSEPALRGAAVAVVLVARLMG